MSNWRPNFRPEHLYFVTTKAVDYVHIFQSDVIKRLLIDTLDHFRIRKRMKLFCFVIMPNHNLLYCTIFRQRPTSQRSKGLQTAQC